MSLAGVEIEVPKDEDAKQLAAHQLILAIKKDDANGLLNAIEKLVDLCTASEDVTEDEG